MRLTSCTHEGDLALGAARALGSLAQLVTTMQTTLVRRRLWILTANPSSDTFLSLLPAFLTSHSMVAGASHALTTSKESATMEQHALTAMRLSM